MSEEYKSPRKSIDTLFTAESSLLLLEHGTYKVRIKLE